MSCKDSSDDRMGSDLWKHMKLRHNVDSSIRHDSIGNYADILKKK